jgi:hypothetical protein
VKLAWRALLAAITGVSIIGVLLASPTFASDYGVGDYGCASYSQGSCSTTSAKPIFNLGPLPVTGPTLLGAVAIIGLSGASSLVVWARSRRRTRSESSPKP